MTAAARIFYTAAGIMTAPGSHARALDKLPESIGELCAVIHGLMVHEHFAPAYRLKLTAQRRAQSQVRPVERMLRHILEDDPGPLTKARPPEKRLVGVCRHFTVMLCAMLRRQGIPARARCGFGAYFNAGRFEDHWVCEHWSAAEGRWILVDAQIDAVQRAIVKPPFDLLDVPRDMFIVAGDAWERCRSGRADPALFGIFDIRGLYFVAGNVLRDFAALNNAEMLPWDVWGAMFRPGELPGADRLALFDRLASLTLAVDQSFDEMRRLYDSDERVRVPAQVFNIQRDRLEPVV